MRRVRSVVLLTGIAAVLATASVAAMADQTVPTHAVVSLTLNGVVDPFAASYIKSGIAAAESQQAEAVLITIDTPGGLDSSMRQITQAILNANVPVICWTGPSGARAASAGTFIMLSCPVNAMAPGTNIGAAHPVGVSGVIEQEKVTNDAAAYIRALADAWGRNADWAEQAVRDAVSIPAEQAVQIHVADLVAPNRDALLEAVDGRSVTLTGGQAVTLHTAGAPISTLSMGWFAGFLHGLVDPNLAFLFFYLGLGLIVVELLHPGLSIPGLVGTIMLVVAVMSFGLLPIELGGVVLLIASAVFFLFELKHPGLGLPTAGGAVCLVLGGLLLFNRSVPNAQVSPWLLAAVAAGAVLFFAVVVKAALAARHGPITAGAEHLIGVEGVAITDVSPRGTVRVGRETWTAEATGGQIVAGSPVRVVRVVGVHLIIEPVAGATPAAGSPEGVASGSQGGRG